MKLKDYYLSTIATLLFFSCNNSKEIKNDLEKQNLFGSVKSIRENTYRAVLKFGEIVKGERNFDEFLGETCNCLTEFNKAGYLIKSFASLSETFKYDKKNQLIEKYYYYNDSKTFFRGTFNYNDKGLLSENNYYSYKNQYSLRNKTKYQYDDEGNQIEINEYEPDGKLYNKTKNTFRDKNLVEVKRYNGDGTFSTHFKSVYDKNGNEIESNFIDETGKTYQKIESKYNDNNLIIELLNSSDNIISKTEYKYKKYDSNKNWTEKIEFINGKAVLVIERKIEYFK